MDIGDRVKTNLEYHKIQLGKWGNLYYQGVVTEITGNLITVDNKKQFKQEYLELL